MSFEDLFAPMTGPIDLPIINFEEDKKAKVLGEVSKGNFSNALKELALGNLDLNDKSEDGYTVMHEAVWRSNFSIVNHLLDEMD
jgi:ankyrin repeat protein